PSVTVGVAGMLPLKLESNVIVTVLPVESAPAFDAVNCSVHVVTSAVVIDTPLNDTAVGADETTIAEDAADVARPSPLVRDAVRWIVSLPRLSWTEPSVTVHVPAAIVPVLPLSVPAPSDAREIPVFELTWTQLPFTSWLCTVTEKFVFAVALAGTEVTASFVAPPAVMTTSFPVPPV